MRRILPLAILVVVAVLAVAFDLHTYVSLETLRTHQDALESLVRERPVVSALAFVAAYTAIVALSLPGATVMSVLGGFLFDLVLGGTLSVIAATVGASVVFLAARTALADGLRRRAGPYLAKIADGFHADAFNYVLALRLIPLFPFWAVNLSMALLKVPTAPYVAATAIGILPGSFVIVAFGAGLNDVLDIPPGSGLSGLFSPTLIFALCGLAALSVLPVLVRRLRRRA